MSHTFFSTKAAMNELAQVYANIHVLNEAISVQQLMQSRKVSEDVARAIISLDATPSKSDALQLAKFYNEINADDEQKMATLQHYYQEFDALRRRRQINAQINAFKTFRDFEHQVDARAAVGQLTQNSSKTSATPDYQDEYIAAWEANNPAEACEIGKGYPFCISRTGAANMFYTYKGSIGEYTKPNDAATGTWFVRLKKRLDGEQVSDQRNEKGQWIQPEHMIVIHYDADGRMRWTWADNGAQGHGTTTITQQEILQQFPEFKPLFENGKIRAGSFSQKEIQMHRMLQMLRSSAQAFNDATPEQKEYYIKTYGDVPFEMETYPQLNAALRNELFKRIQKVSAALWAMMPDADQLKLAKMTALPQVHMRNEKDNAALIYNLLVLDIQ